MARRSLQILASACALAGCLVAEPPDQENPVTPPLVDLTQTFPLVTQITTLRENDQQTFSVAVRSEDQGDSLIGILTLDFSLESEQRLGNNEIAASTFDDTTRKLPVGWTVTGNLSGCHQITMRITHRGNLSLVGEFEPKSPRDVGMATWWVNINPDETNPEDLGTCPRPKTTP